MTYDFQTQTFVFGPLSNNTQTAGMKEKNLQWCEQIDEAYMSNNKIKQMGEKKNNP